MKNKSLVAFSKDKKSKDGLRHTCKSCEAKYYESHKENIAEYYRNNKEAIAKREAIYRENNKETIAEYSAKYRENNKETIAEYSAKYRKNNKEALAKYREDNKEIAAERSAKWQRANPEKTAASCAKRRSLKLGQRPIDANLTKIAKIYKEAHRLTEQTGIKYHIDHIIPLSKGGLHHENNLQILTATENLQKGAKLPNQL